MARSIAGDPPANLPPAPFQTPPNGLAVPAASPFNYTNQPAPGGSTVQTTPTPAGLLNAFRRRWVLGTFLGVLAAAAVAVGLWMVMPGGKHQARALIQIRPRTSGFANKNPEEFEAYRRHQIFLLKTHDLFTRTLADPAVASLDTVKQAGDPVQMLGDQIKVAPATPEILEVTMTGNNLDDMKLILENLTRKYIDEATFVDRKERDDEIEKLKQQADAKRLEIESMEKDMQLIGRGNNTIGGQDTATQLAILQTRFASADAEYNRIGRALIGMDAEIKILKAQLASPDPKYLPDPKLIDQLIESSDRVVKAKVALDEAKRKLASAIETAGGPEKANDVPFVLELKADVDKLEKVYQEARKFATAEARERARIVDAANKQTRVTQLETQREIKREEREKLQLERDGTKKFIEAGVGGGFDIEKLRKIIEPERIILDQLNTHLATRRFQRNLDSAPILRGTPETIPNRNQTKKVAISTFGGLGSFLVVVLLVAYLEWRTRRVDSVDQVVSELGMRVIGTVPAFPNRANLKAAVEAGGANWKFVLNESINSTRTMLLHSARAQSMQVVMVTSATQGEGKTSLASQLASSMATAGMRTLIVDCDLRNPSIQNLFELPLGPGVSEVLRQEVDVSDVVQATAVPNLWIIPAGQCSNATIAALAQGHPLETLFNRLRGQFDFIIVDSCPVLPVADALLIAQHVDGVVFSIMQDVSQLPKVMTASEKLAQLNIQFVGAVVNGIKQDVYSYGYNYVKQLPA